MRFATSLLVTRDRSLVESVSQVIDSVEHSRLIVAEEVEDALAQLDREHISLVLFHLPNGDDETGRQFLSKSQTGPRTPPSFIAICDDYRPDQILGLFRLGAQDCLSRPLDLRRLAYLVDSLTLRARYVDPSNPSSPLVEDDSRLGDPDAFLCSDPELTRVMELVHRLAPEATTVLLTGETGTGKTRLARYMHEISPRRKERLLILNCGALSASLIESEMFGHVRGAFTGADRDRCGKFFEAGRGTLVLDDVDALPIEIQSKLLRVVDERVFEQVGSNKALPLRARLIAVSNRMLDEEVKAGRFRNDLYFRLNVVELKLPPLRACSSAIRALTEYFVALISSQNGHTVDGLSDEALEALEAYNWPGNVRELRNAIERAVTLAGGPQIGLDDLPETLRKGAALELPATFPGDFTLADTRSKAEALCIARALRKYRNNRSRAARELGISRVALYKKLHKYGMIGGQPPT